MLDLLPLSVEVAALILALVGVRAEEVTLRLRQVLWQVYCAITIKIGERRAETYRWNAS